MGRLVLAPHPPSQSSVRVELEQDAACTCIQPHSLSGPITRGPISLTMRSPLAVSGMSVDPVFDAVTSDQSTDYVSCPEAVAHMSPVQRPFRLA